MSFPNQPHKFEQSTSTSDIDQNISETKRNDTPQQIFTGETWYHYDSPKGRNDPINIIHFNDVYNVEVIQEGEIGGISRFITALQRSSSENSLVLFSGDAFSPSNLSTHTKGRHMVPFLNMLKIHTACFGNHDFDFGIDHLEYMVGSTHFPWLLSNVNAIETNAPLANGLKYRLFEWQGIRIGIIGLVEMEWIETLICIEPSDIIYQDYVEAANELSAMLRSKEAELIIALTHMRAPNDERLAREANDIDLILGGHDHEYYGAHQFGKCIVVKSGTDFKEFTKITIHPGIARGNNFLSAPGYPSIDIPFNSNPNNSESSTRNISLSSSNSDKSLFPSENTSGYFLMKHFLGGSIFEWERIEVNPLIFYPNIHVDIMVKKYLHEIEQNMEEMIGETSVHLETRFSIIRRNECNVGNWLCDLMRTELHANIALLNSGTIRSDCEYHPGSFRIKHLCSMLPMPDGLVLIEITGEKLIDALENSVSKYPKTEGRFPQVSGLKFSFSCIKEPGKRIDRSSVLTLENGSYTPLKLSKIYRLATKEYLRLGKDGYDMLNSCPVLRDQEMNGNLPTMVQNVFTIASLANGYGKPHSTITENKLKHFVHLSNEERCSSYGFILSDNKYKLAPIVEGRIKALHNNN